MWYNAMGGYTLVKMEEQNHILEHGWILEIWWVFKKQDPENCLYYDTIFT